MILSNYLKQKAVYWGSPSYDGYGGRTFASPVEILCRWVKKNEMFIDASGRETVSNAVVIVGQSLDLGGFLYLGTLLDLDSSSVTPDDVSGITGAKEIRAITEVPDLQGTMVVRRAFL
jgi:hypothetical protein